MEKSGDVEKIMKMALVHDITESRNGDVDYISRQYVDRKEEMAIKDMLGQTILEQEFLEIWEEYDRRESIEARIVKDADNIEIDFELREQAVKGNQMEKVLVETRQFVGENKLYTKSGKKLWKAVKGSTPTDWFMKGRNRINAGDWKK